MFSPSWWQISTIACLAKAVIACCTMRMARFTSSPFIRSTYLHQGTAGASGHERGARSLPPRPQLAEPAQATHFLIGFTPTFGSDGQKTKTWSVGSSRFCTRMVMSSRKGVSPLSA